MLVTILYILLFPVATSYYPGTSQYLYSVNDLVNVYDVMLSREHLHYRVLTRLVLVMKNYDGYLDIPLIIIERSRGDLETITQSIEVLSVYGDGGTTSSELVIDYGREYVTVYARVYDRDYSVLRIEYTYITDPEYSYGDRKIIEELRLPTGIYYVKNYLSSDLVEYTVRIIGNDYIVYSSIWRETVFVGEITGNEETLSLDINLFDKPFSIEIFSSCVPVDVMLNMINISRAEGMLYILTNSVSSCGSIIVPTDVSIYNDTLDIDFTGCLISAKPSVYEEESTYTTSNLYIVETDLENISTIEISVNGDPVYVAPVDGLSPATNDLLQQLLDISSIYLINMSGQIVYMNVPVSTETYQLVDTTGGGETITSTETYTGTEVPTTNGHVVGNLSPTTTSQYSGLEQGYDGYSLVIALAIALAVGVILHIILSRK